MEKTRGLPPIRTTRQMNTLERAGISSSDRITNLQRSLHELGGHPPRSGSLRRRFWPNTPRAAGWDRLPSWTQGPARRGPSGTRHCCSARHRSWSCYCCWDKGHGEQLHRKHGQKVVDTETGGKKNPNGFDSGVKREDWKLELEIARDSPARCDGNSDDSSHSYCSLEFGDFAGREREGEREIQKCVSEVNKIFPLAGFMGSPVPYLGSKHLQAQVVRTYAKGITIITWLWHALPRITNQLKIQ